MEENWNHSLELKLPMAPRTETICGYLITSHLPECIIMLYYLFCRQSCSNSPSTVAGIAAPKSSADPEVEEEMEPSISEGCRAFIDVQKVLGNIDCLLSIGIMQNLSCS